MSITPIQLKGSNFTLSVIYIYNAKPEEIRRAIEKKIEQNSIFLKYAPVVINIAAISHDSQWEALSQALFSTGLHVVGVSGCNNNKLKQTIVNSGLPLISENRHISNQSSKILNKTKFINTPVRSGQRIYAFNSDLVIANNVSNGAELIADGNIHVYGIMRGRALAGASGDSECQIFCTYFSPELVSIAGQYWLKDQIPNIFLEKSVRLCLKNNSFNIYYLVNP